LLRIDDRLLMEYWPVGETAERSADQPRQEVDEAITDFITRPTTDLLAHGSAREADQADLVESRLGPWLMKVDWALELILKAVARMSPQGLALPRLLNVNISGGGICFEASRPFQEGDQLELRLILPPFVPVHTVAEVVRAEPAQQERPASSEAPARYTVAARFTSISAEDRERLIRHILRLQAERIRARHMGAAYTRGEGQ